MISHSVFDRRLHFPTIKVSTNPRRKCTVAIPKDLVALSVKSPSMIGNEPHPNLVGDYQMIKPRSHSKSQNIEILILFNNSFQRVDTTDYHHHSKSHCVVVSMSASADFSNPLRKFKLVFLGEQSGECINCLFM